MGRGGVVKKRESPDFRSPEAGISGKVSFPRSAKILTQDGLSLFPLF